MSIVGRPKEHGEQTAVALLGAAERAVQAGGPEAVSIRGLADAVGTTTRAVYSLFGSKEGLLVALGARAFDLLAESLDAMPETDDPAADLVELGAILFRRFALDHPTLFRIGVQRALVPQGLVGQFENARLRALARLESKVQRLAAAGQLTGRPVPVATRHFHALCEGLADMELRSQAAGADQEDLWRDALGALVAGLAVPPA